MTNQWQREDVAALFDAPFLPLVMRANVIHQKNFPKQEIQLSTLMSIKTGACPEDCGYCSQSGHHATGLEKERLLPIASVIERAKKAKAKGATRFCMGAAWRNPPKKDFPKVLAMIKTVKSMGLETCVTLGMLDSDQAQQLKEAGLDYYNHNLDTSENYYKDVITTRCYQDRLDTLEEVRKAGINTCCGGIVGMGETREDRIDLLTTLTNLPEQPQSVPINRLVPIPGTPLKHATPIDNFEFIRTIAIARILMPTSYVRLSAGRESMSDETQALCFLAGANSIFYEEELLTVPNNLPSDDKLLLDKLGLKTENYEPCA